MAELNRYLSDGKNSNYRYNSAMLGLPQFLKFFGYYVKSIEYSSELLRKISKIVEVLARRNYTDNSSFPLRTNSGVIPPC